MISLQDLQIKSEEYLNSGAKSGIDLIAWRLLKIRAKRDLV